MPYPVPQGVGPVAQEALAMAMDYLEQTGRAFPYSETQRLCAFAFVNEWSLGRRHRLWLANKAIITIELALSKPSSQQIAATSEKRG
jgi:hypothetical protein